MTASPEQLRTLAGTWRAELHALGARPRLRDGTNRRTYRARIEDWHHREAAIAGAVELATEREQRDLGDVAAQARRLRLAGLSFVAVARALGIPAGSAKTYVRQQQLAGGAA